MTPRITTLALITALSAQVAPAQAPDPALERALKVLRAAPLVDGHNDLPWVIREKLGGDVEGYDISVRARFDTDIPRLREGGVGAQFWSVYVPSALSPFEAMRAQLEQIDIVRRLVERYDDLMLATSVAEVEEARRQGRIASLIGIEGGHTIGGSLGALRSYYRLGVRYMTLTHFHGHEWADSATDDARHGGLTDFGRDVIREMNRLGMLVDLSHVSAATMHDVLDVSEAPVIFSHSSARALTDHPRNVPDKVLERLSDNGGVVMVTFIPEYVDQERRDWGSGLTQLLKEAESDADWERIAQSYRAERGDPPLATLEDVADHVEHLARIAGHDHVGVGSDFYGAEGDDLVVGLEDVSRFPHLLAELARRGWSDENLEKLARANVLRAFVEAERTAERVQRARPPSLERIEEPAADPGP